MKIALIVRKLNIKGGTQRQAIFLAREFQKMGHEVKIFTFVFSPENCYGELLKNLPVVALEKYPQSRNYFLNLMMENRLAKKLAGLIDEDTEILNPHDQVSYRVAYYFKKKIKNIPSIWTMNDLPIKTWSFWRDSQFEESLNPSRLKKLAYWLVDFYEIRRFIKPQDKIIVLDERDRGWVKEYFNKDSAVVRCGLDLENFGFRERTGLAPKISILMVGIFFPHRRFEDGLWALKMLKDKKIEAGLNIVGDFKAARQYHQKILNLIKKLDLTESVYLSGRVSEEELGRFYEQSDIFIFPSHWQSWGLAVFEAMAVGLPVIVSRTAGASEVLSDRENALLVDPESPEEIFAAVLALKNESGLYQKLSRQGRKFAEENISWRKEAEEYLKIFADFLKK